MDDPGQWCLPAAGIFTILTLFFSAGNLALRNISWVRLEEAFKKKNHPERTGRMRELQFKLLATTAMLRLMSNLALLLSIVQLFILKQEHTPGTSIIPLLEAFLLSALILSLFSVSIPHAISQCAGTTLLVHSFPVLTFFYYLVLPITYALGVVEPVIRRLAGVNAENGNGSLEEKQEELLNVVEEGEKEGVVDEEEREMIASVLEFRDTTAGEIMTPRTEIVALEINLSLREAVDIILREGHSRYPVYEETIDKIVGMLYAKDLLRDINQPNETKNLRDRLREPFYVPESKTVRDLLHDFQNQKVHVAIVLDEYGGTAGLVTIEDVLEELVGEIVDEYEPPQNEPVKKIDEHTFIIDARCEVRELNDDYDLGIPEDDDYETIGGFAFARLGYIPKTGESFTYNNLSFTIIDAGERKINRIRLVVQPQEDDSGNDK